MDKELEVARLCMWMVLQVCAVRTVFEGYMRICCHKLYCAGGTSCTALDPPPSSRAGNSFCTHILQMVEPRNAQCRSYRCRCRSRREGWQSGAIRVFRRGHPQRREVENICPYLVPYKNIVINALSNPISDVAEMTNGNKPADGGHLIFDLDEAIRIRASDVRAAAFIRRFVGGDESIKGSQRFCLWIQDKDKD